MGVRIAPRASAMERGVIISGVLPGSPADVAGLQPGDAVLCFENARVEAASDLQVAVAAHKPGDQVKLVIDRYGQRKTLKMKLGKYARWHGDIPRLNEQEVRQLLQELLSPPLASSGIGE